MDYTVPLRDELVSLEGIVHWEKRGDGAMTWKEEGRYALYKIKSKVKQKSKKPLKKTKKGDGAPKGTESVSAADKIADSALEEGAP